MFENPALDLPRFSGELLAHFLGRSLSHYRAQVRAYLDMTGVREQTHRSDEERTKDSCFALAANGGGLT